MDSTLYVNGICDEDSLSSNIEDLFLKSTNNLEWLQPGELVLLKPALNSAHPYPATTHPLAVKVISEILERNKVKVVVGDQSGIRSVLHHQEGVVRGNSRKNYIKSGMGTGKDNFIAFEVEGWDDGFIHHQSKKTPSWKNGFYITHWINKADHIINLPRISTHTQAGATLGFKNMIGILRDDSRMEYHANGPYNYLIKFNAHKSSLKSIDDHSGTFLEKIVEISDAVWDKLRLTLFVATKAQTTFGPDSHSLKLGEFKINRSHISNLKPGLIFASQDQVACESFALATLKYLRKTLPILAKLNERIILLSSNNTHKIDKIPIRDHPYLKHAIDMGMGEIPSGINYQNVPVNLRRDIEFYLNE